MASGSALVLLQRCSGCVTSGSALVLVQRVECGTMRCSVAV